MRKITRQSTRAFLDRVRFNAGNMHVDIGSDPNDVRLQLHGNTIARSYLDQHGNPVIEIRDAGWRTVTTKERLNGLLQQFAPGWYIYQKDYAWYLAHDVFTKRGGDIPWEGSAGFTRSGCFLCSPVRFGVNPIGHSVEV